MSESYQITIRGGYNLSVLGEPWVVSSVVPNTHREGFSTIYISGKVSRRSVSIGVKTEMLHNEELVRNAIVEGIKRHFNYVHTS